MLTAEDRAIIKATVPLLESGGEALTTHFYKMMLSEYPEVRPLFNQAHQASGDQPRALANGVLMYARHIDQLEQLGGLVGQIVNKHVALQILPAPACCAPSRKCSAAKSPPLKCSRPGARLISSWRIS